MSKTRSFDRAAHLRSDESLTTQRMTSPEAVLLPLWRNKSLVQRAESTELVLLDSQPSLLEMANERVFLGLLEDKPCFALALPGNDEIPGLPELEGRGQFTDLRMAGPFMSREDAELAAYARGIAYWHRHHGYCGKCGGKTVSEESGHVRACEGCGKKHFPRTDPAIMALIMHEGRCLLARQPKWPGRMHSILAGFVEPGESLEQAVVREVREEVGLEVAELRYLRSQSWPFPSSLMLGFAMDAVTTEIQLGDDELESAGWYSKEQIREGKEITVPPAFSLAGQLIEKFLADAL